MAIAGRKRGRKKIIIKKKKMKKKKNKTLITKKITKLTRKFKATLPLRHQHCTQLIPQLISAISSAHTYLLNHDLHLLPHQSLSLESLISSTSTYISNIVSLLSLPPPPPRASRASVTPPRASACWFERLLVADSDTLWAENFNMTKGSFTLLLRLLTSSLSSLSVAPNYALALTLYRLAHGGSFSAVSRRFGIDSATACRVFYAVCKAINENLGHLFELKSDINRVIVGFGWISLPNCCGVLGVEKFEFLGGDLIGEDGFLIVQGLVDSEGRFLDVSAGWPGSMKPDSVLRKSKLYLGVEELKEYLNGSSFELNDGNLMPQYILGDSCFPLLPWLLTPYSGSNEEEDGAKMAFNSVHRKGMQLVGKAFGGVREKWKLLAKKWNEHCVEAFPFVIVTCCLLHNFLIKCSEAVTDENEEYPRCEEFPVFDGELDESGKKTRDALASHLFRVSQRE